MRTAIALLGLLLAFLATPPASADMTVALAPAEAPLNGPWAFRLGNDPRWASPRFDDRAWEWVDLTPPAGAHDGDVGLPGYVPGWAARGHAGAWGHAWYRLRVRWRMPAGTTPVLVGPPLVDGAYEIYWNGRRIGGIGNFAADPPNVYATRPQLFPLDATGSSGEAIVAIHIYMPSASLSDPEAGGLHIAPVLADPAAGAARHIAQWWQTFWGYVVDLVEPLALLTLAAFALSLWRFAHADHFLPLAAAALAAIALSRLNQPLLFWTEVETLHAYTIARFVILNPLAIMLWTAACYRLGGWTDRRIDGAIGLCGFLAGLAAFPGIDAQPALTAARLALLLLFCGGLLHVARAARPRLFALPATLAVAAAIFSDELSMIGIKGIWFPWGVGVSRTQYALALAVPLVAALVHVRTAPSRISRMVQK